MRSTSGRMALRVCAMSLLQGGELLPRGVERLVHPVRRGAAGHIVTGQNGLDLQRVIEIALEGRVEFTQFLERELLELALMLQTPLHGLGHNFMRLSKRHTPFCQ